MSNYGITVNGFNTKTLEEAKLEIESQLKAAWGSDFQLNTEEPGGQIVGIRADRESLIWEKMEDIYNAFNLNTATGIQLDILGSIAGVQRKDANESIISRQVFIGTDGTVVPKDTIVYVENDPEKEYKTENEVTLSSGEDAIINVDKLMFNGTYRLVIDGETSGIIDYSNSESEIADTINNMLKFDEATVDASSPSIIVINLGKLNIQTLSYINIDVTGPGTPSAVIAENGEYQAYTSCVATVAKYQIANSLSVTEFQNPITGVDRTFNPEDSSPGSDIESDEDYRLSIKKGLSSGNATLDAIRNRVLDIGGIDDCWVVENDKWYDDAVGRPPKSIEIYVYQINPEVGDEQRIADAIRQAKGAGIETVGDIENISYDVQGRPHIIKHSLPDEVDIYLTLTLTKTSDYPTNGDDTLKDNIVTWGNALGAGKDVVVYPSLMLPINTVSGIEDVIVDIGTTPTPSGDDNIEIGDGISDVVQISAWDTSRIIIVDA